MKMVMMITITVAKHLPSISLPQTHPTSLLTWSSLFFCKTSISLFYSSLGEKYRCLALKPGPSASHPHFSCGPSSSGGDSALQLLDDLSTWFIIKVLWFTFPSDETKKAYGQLWKMQLQHLGPNFLSWAIMMDMKMYPPLSFLGATEEGMINHLML